MKTILALILLSASSFAGVQYVSGTIAPADRPCAVWQYGQPSAFHLAPNVRVEFPGFDSSLGTLVDVEIVFNHTPTWQYRAENLFTQSGASSVSWTRGYQLNVVYRPNFVGPVCFDLSNTVGDNGASYTAQRTWGPLTAFDGVEDFAGTSGLATAYGNSGQYTGTTILHPNTPRELAYFSFPGTKAFYISPRVLTDVVSGFPLALWWSSEDDVRLNLNGSVSIKYTYQ